MPRMPPSDLLMQISNSPNVEDFENSFAYVRDEVAAYLDRCGYSLQQFGSILDFGCGVGRFAYAVGSALSPSQKLYGCDVDERCATWSGENAGYTEVLNNALNPPLSWANDSFDFIYALSVFTHLTLEYQFRWAWEMNRLLKPGGVLMCSTHGMGQFLPALVNGIHWVRKDVFLLDGEGLLAILAVSGGDEIEGQREVAAFHNRQSVATQFYPLVSEFHAPLSTMAGAQSMNVLSKKHSQWQFARAASNAGSNEILLLNVPEDIVRPLQCRAFFSPATAQYNFAGHRAVARVGMPDGGILESESQIPVLASLGKHHMLDLRFALQDVARGPIQISVRNGAGEPVGGSWSFAHWLAPN